MRFLALLLSSPAGNSFRSLPCIGWLAWEERERFALIYDLPDHSSHGRQVHWSMKSLYDLISEKPRLSLSRRFHIATDLADVVLQLHTAGWLHKSFRSENVIFLAPRGSSATTFLQSSPYLVGYEYARPDTADAAVFTQLPDTSLIADLYRHPHARGVLRQKYQKAVRLICIRMYTFGACIVAASSRHTIFLHITRIDESDRGRYKFKR